MVTAMNRPVGWLVIGLAVVLFAIVVHGWDQTSLREGLAIGTVLEGLGTLQSILSTGNAKTFVFENSKGARQVVILIRSGYEDAIHALLAEAPRLSRAHPTQD